jgi:hypothetical protein
MEGVESYQTHPLCSVQGRENRNKKFSSLPHTPFPSNTHSLNEKKKGKKERAAISIISNESVQTK